MSDRPIDEIVNKAVVAEAAKCGAILVGINPAVAIRAALLREGYSIQLDPNALLARGEENVAGGTVHDGMSSQPATMESTLDPRNPNRHQLWPIDGGKT